LQLDVHNYFNTIHRPTLYAMLGARLAQQERRGQLPASHTLALRSLCHKLLARRVSVHQRDPAAAQKLPAHKRLCNSAPACGLPVGNLTSQFFANVYLNALDQFVKHTLKVRHYVRYVAFVVVSFEFVAVSLTSLTTNDSRLTNHKPWLKTLFNLGVDAHLYLKAPARWQKERRHCVRQFLKPEGENL
jgi:hypothetical protein